MRHDYHPSLQAPCEYLYFYSHSARLRTVGLVWLRYQCAGLGSAQELDLNGTTFNDPVPIVLRSSCTPESTRSISAIQLGMRLTWTGLLLLQPSCLDCPGTEKIASAGELSFGGTVLFRETTNSRTRGHVTVIGTCAVCLCGREPPVPCTLTGCVAAAQHALAWPRCQDEGLSFPPGTG
jgi:hypothetical protein